MPRSSRHKSHRSHKQDRSDSEDDGNSRERKARVEELAAGSSARVSRDAESEKRKSSSAALSVQPSQGKDPIGAGNGDRKRKDRAEDSVVVVDDRWNGGGDDDHVVDKKPKPEVFESVDAEKAAKSKLSAGDSKSRSSRRHEGSSEKNEDSKVELAKPRSEKDSSRRESIGSQYKNAKEKDSKDTKEKDRDYSKDTKGRDKDYSKDTKERDRDHVKDAKDVKDAKERDKDHVKDAKEKDRDHSKDAKERDSKERDRDHYKDTKERDKDYYKEDRDRDHDKDAKERDRDNYKDVKERDRDSKDARERGRDSKDARERDRDYSKETKDRDRDYSKDARERDRDHYKDARERDRDYSKDARERDRERGSERDKRVQDTRHDRSDDVVSRKHASKISSSEEHSLKKNTEISGGQIHDGLRNPEPEKELDKHIKRRESSGDKGKSLIDGRDSDDRRLSSRDDHTKNSSYKDESQREGRYRDRYKEDIDRDQRHRDDRARDEHSSREHNNSRTDNKHYRDENRLPESRYKKSKVQEIDRDSSPYVDDHGTKLKDNKARKRFSDESDDHIDLKSQSAKEPHEDMEKNAPSTTKFDPHTDRARMDYLHADKVDSSLGSNRPKSSPSSGNHTMKDQFRSSSKQAGSSGRKSLPEETLRLSAASRGDHVAVSGAHERDSESRSLEKTKPKEGVRSGEVEPVAPHYDKTKSDARTSPNSLVEKSSSTANDRRFSDKMGARRSLDIEGHKSSSSKHGRDCSNTRDRERGLPFEKSISNDLSRGELLDSEPMPTGLTSFNRNSHLSGSSPSHLPPPPPAGHGIGSPSVLGSYEDDNRVQIGDRKSNSRYKRSGDHSMGRGQGHAWKSPSTWPSPVANGFFPLHHGPPPPGFHPAVQQFPSALFGVRPSMELNHSGVSYHMHEAADRFSSHGRPFGWHNPMDDCPPPLQVWDGRNGVFGDESHVYGRPEWDMNRHLMGSRGWEMNADMWKGQNGNMNILPMPQESEYSASGEGWTGQTDPQSRKERVPSERLPDDSSEVERSNDKFPAEMAVETPRRGLHETPEPSKTIVPDATKTPNENNNVRICFKYLSNLDISLDLVRPELYQECMSLLGTRDKASLYNNVPNNVPKQDNSQNNKEGPGATTKSTNHILSSLFPSRTDAVFQRAMSLYKKHSSGRKVICPVSPSSCPEEKDSSEVSEAEKSRGVDKLTNSADTSLEEEVNVADNQTSSDSSLANADSTCSVVEGRDTTTDPEGSHPGDDMEQQSDSISDAVHVVEGSQSCENIMAECRVNLCRIHLSPGSTH